eukprot:3456356-Lingulodinium_polyedra.AAC.1
MPCCPQVCDGQFYLEVGGRADKALEHPPCLHAVLDHSGWRRSTRGEREGQPRRADSTGGGTH